MQDPTQPPEPFPNPNPGQQTGQAPNATPQGAPVQQAPAQAPQGDAFGFHSGPQDEKYNTEYLTKNLAAERKRTQLMIVATIAAVLIGVSVLFMFMPKKEAKLPAPEGIPGLTEPAATPKAPAEAQPEEQK